MFYLQVEKVKFVTQTFVYFGECIRPGKAFSSSLPVMPQMISSAFRVAAEECLLSKMVD